MTDRREKMNKPFTMEIKDLNTRMVEALNESPLHPYVKVKLLEDLTENMNKILSQTIAMEEKEYNESISEEEEN